VPQVNFPNLRIFSPDHARILLYTSLPPNQANPPTKIAGERTNPTGAIIALAIAFSGPG